MNARDGASIYCGFSSPGEPVAIRIDAGALNRLKQQVLAGKPSGREPSGILLGRVDRALHNGASHSVLAIENFIVVRSDGSKGRPSSDSRADSDLLQRELQELQSHHGDSRAVGLFRGNCRREPAPAMEDVNLMANHFGDCDVLLLIDGSGKRIFATFYRMGAREQSGIHASYPIYLDGPPPGERSLECPNAELSQLDPESPEVTPEESRAHAGWAGEVRGGRVNQIALVLAGAAIIVMGALQYRTLKLVNQQRQEPPNASGGLDLKAERSGGENQWRLSWNRSASAIRTAGKGHISIVDGYLRKELDISAADLQGSAGVIYSPVADDVTFRLEVFEPQAGRAVIESIRVLAGSRPYWGAADLYAREQPPDTAGGNNPASLRDPRARGKERDRSTESPGAAHPRNQSGQAPEPSKTRGVQPLRAFVPPSRPAEPVIVSRSVGDLPAPPVLQWSAGSAERSTPALTAPLVAAISPPLPKPDHAPPPPAVRNIEGGAGNPAQVSPPAGASVSAGQQSRYSGVDPPTLLRRTDPQYPVLAAQKHVTGTVRVQATVGPDGRLHDPRVLSGPPLLRGAAVEALKHWTYSPARINGQIVSAPATIEIRFGSREAPR